MSNRRFFRGPRPTLLPVILAWALLWGWGNPLGAQPVDQERIAAARARVDSLIPVLERLLERRDSAREALLEKGRREGGAVLDTFVVGPLKVAAEPHEREWVRELVEEVWAGFEPLVGGSESLLDPYHFVILYRWNLRPPFLPEDSVRLTQVHRRQSRAFLAREVRRSVGGVLVQGLPEEVAEWSGGLAGVSREERRWAARDLLTAPSRAARACYRGEIEWCWEALGLGPATGRWEGWYTPRERRFLVEGLGPRRQGTREGALWTGCVEGENPEACDLFLQDLQPRIPLGTGTRASFLAHALRVGGRGAFERLRSGEAIPIRDRLTAAGGLSPDSLISTWRQEILRQRPDAWAGLIRSPLSVLAWLLLFGALATRSTRWRMG